MTALLKRTDYPGFFVDSLTTNSGDIFRWISEGSRFSCAALMPSSTIPAALAPIASMGCRTVVSVGV